MRRKYDCDTVTRNEQETLLVRAAKLGEEAAFIELYRRTLPVASRAIYRILRYRADAEDAPQDCMLNAYTHLNQFDERASFSTWVTRIAINSALQILRKHNKYRPEVPVDEAGNWSDLDIRKEACDAETRCLQAELTDHLRNAIRGLPARLRHVVELEQSKDATLEEISDALNLSIPAVKTRLFRGRLALRKVMQAKMQSTLPAAHTKRWLLER